MLAAPRQLCSGCRNSVSVYGQFLRKNPSPIEAVAKASNSVGHRFTNPEPAISLLSVRTVGEAKGEAVCKWIDDAKGQRFGVVRDLG